MCMCLLEEHKDPSMLEQQVVKAIQAVHIASQLSGQEGQGQKERKRVANMMGNYARGYKNNSSQSRSSEPISDTRGGGMSESIESSHAWLLVVFRVVPEQRSCYIILSKQIML